jgi:Protein of unknown function (DUF3311)
MKEVNMMRFFKRLNIVPEPSHIGSIRHSTKENPQKKASRKAWHWLLFLPFLGLLWPPLYAKTDPVLFGFPFFYWYQFAWVIVSAFLTGIVYLATRRR